VDENVVTGHANGVVTIDLGEADGVHREYVKSQLDEVYRTMSGHFRTRSDTISSGSSSRTVLRRCFPGQGTVRGDDRVDYQETINRHYSEGPPENWEESHISAYATMHPYEDFAETWAHYLHISDTVETVVRYGLISPLAVEGRSFRELVTSVWMPLSTALNMVNRSMGSDDLYPFVIPSPVLDKLDFVASLNPA
jgi:hypothetical protein